MLDFTRSLFLNFEKYRTDYDWNNATLVELDDGFYTIEYAHSYEGMDPLVLDTVATGEIHIVSGGNDIVLNQKGDLRGSVTSTKGTVTLATADGGSIGSAAERFGAAAARLAVNSAGDLYAKVGSSDPKDRHTTGLADISAAGVVDIVASFVGLNDASATIISGANRISLTTMYARLGDPVDPYQLTLQGGRADEPLYAKVAGAYGAIVVDHAKEVFLTLENTDLERSTIRTGGNLTVDGSGWSMEFDEDDMLSAAGSMALTGGSTVKVYGDAAFAVGGDLTADVSNYFEIYQDLKLKDTAKLDVRSGSATIRSAVAGSVAINTNYALSIETATARNGAVRLNAGARLTLHQAAAAGEVALGGISEYIKADALTGTGFILASAGNITAANENDPIQLTFTGAGRKVALQNVRGGSTVRIADVNGGKLDITGEADPGSEGFIRNASDLAAVFGDSASMVTGRVTLNRNVTLNRMLSLLIGEGDELTLDLNGYTLSFEVENDDRASENSSPISRFRNGSPINKSGAGILNIVNGVIRGVPNSGTPTMFVTEGTTNVSGLTVYGGDGSELYSTNAARILNGNLHMADWGSNGSETRFYGQNTPIRTDYNATVTKDARVVAYHFTDRTKTEDKDATETYMTDDLTAVFSSDPLPVGPYARFLTVADNAVIISMRTRHLTYDDQATDPKVMTPVVVATSPVTKEQWTMTPGTEYTVSYYKQDDQGEWQVYGSVPTQKTAGSYKIQLNLTDRVLVHEDQGINLAGVYAMAGYKR